MCIDASMAFAHLIGPHAPIVYHFLNGQRLENRDPLTVEREKTTSSFLSSHPTRQGSDSPPNWKTRHFTFVHFDINKEGHGVLRR